MTPTDLQALGVQTFGRSSRGFAAELDGKVVAVAGVLHSAPVQAYSLMAPEMRKHPKAIVRFLRQFRQFLEMNYAVVYAVPSVGERNSRKVLERIGFVPHENGVYRWQIP